MKKKKKILVVGQTPPPYGGQAIMIEQMLKSHYENIEFFHARMNFSSNMKDVGKLQFKKIWELLKIILSIYLLRIRYNITTLYYPPAGPNRIPMYRDLIILNTVRWMFKETIFHFHAAGISEIHKDLRGLIKKLFERAYFYPDLALRLSRYNPEDGIGLKAKREEILPNGLPDHAKDYLPITRGSKLKPIVLFVGALIESKGVLIIIESANILNKMGLDFEIHLMGRFKSKEFKFKVDQSIKAYDLSQKIKFLGVCIGENKNQAFLNADLLCFPTYFESETFGLVLLEAMQFQLPVVSTKWRGIPDIVKDGENGFTVPIRDPQMLSEKLAMLIIDEKLRSRMGMKGRMIFEKKYTIKPFIHEIENQFTEI